MRRRRRRSSPQPGAGSGLANRRQEVTMNTGEPEFRGRIGRTIAESEPWWPEAPRPPKAAPNIVLVVLDDTGFAHLGCYGSEIETPNMDRLAANGAQYSNFHTTALCSPSRASLLTGPRHHAARRDRRGDLALARVRDVLRRQVAPGADARVLRGRPP